MMPFVIIYYEFFGNARQSQTGSLFQYCLDLLLTDLKVFVFVFFLTLLLLNTSCPVLANSVDPDQLASEEAN